MWGKDASNFNFQLLMPNAEKLEKTPAGPWWVYARGLSEGFFPHNSLVYYLAQVIKAKNCPTTFYCIFQLIWVPSDRLGVTMHPAQPDWTFDEIVKV